MATLTTVSGLGAKGPACFLVEGDGVHSRLADCIALVRSTAARTVLPAFGDARHGDEWRSAFDPASVLLRGPVVL
jgi:hypothetical protein